MLSAKYANKEQATKAGFVLVSTFNAKLKASLFDVVYSADMDCWIAKISHIVSGSKPQRRETRNYVLNVYPSICK